MSVKEPTNDGEAAASVEEDSTADNGKVEDPEDDAPKLTAEEKAEVA